MPQHVLIRWHLMVTNLASITISDIRSQKRYQHFLQGYKGSKLTYTVSHYYIVPSQLAIVAWYHTQCETQQPPALSTLPRLHYLVYHHTI